LQQPLFQDKWEDITLPDEWNHLVIVKIPKKGNLNDCNNWRGITLHSIPSKIMAKIIIIRRISTAVDTKLRQEQAGFRPAKGCVHQIFTLRNTIEQCNELQMQLYISFIDVEKALIVSIETVSGK
jgi:hypothetical protein